MSLPVRVPASGPHLRFVKTKVPDWLLCAPTDHRHALRRAGREDHVRLSRLLQSKPDVAAVLLREYRLHVYNEARLNEVRGQLPSLESFAEPLLKAAIKERFSIDVDVRHTYLFHARRVQTDNSFLGASADPFVQLQQSLRAATQTLLHAALQNFESWETDAGALDLDARHKAAIYDHHPIVGPGVTGEALPITPHEFAALCRELDLGGHYQKKISAFLNPPSREADAPDAAAFNRRGLFKGVEQSAFSIQVHLAYLHGDVSDAMYATLLEVARNGTRVTLDGQPVTCSYLRLWDVELTGIVAIGKERDSADAVQPVVVYIPEDPVCPLKEYASGAAFTQALRDRMLQDGYLDFFQRFVPARHWAQLFIQLNDHLKPEVWSPEKRLYERQIDPNAKLHMRDQRCETGLLTALVEQKLRTLQDDALFHAVPTAQEDQKSFAERVHYFENIALQLFNAAGFVVPAVGAVMMGVAAVQLVTEVVEGVDSWTRGEWEQGWAYIMDVVENMAMMAALAAVHGSETPAMETIEVETPSFIEELQEVELPDGSTRLWKPDMAPFAHDIVLPSGLVADEFGVYHHQGKAWIAVEDQVFSVRKTSVPGQYLVEHPSRKNAFQPLMNSNGAGIALHPADKPLEWQGLKLFRRLGHRAEAFSDESARQILQVCDVRETVLRRVLAEHGRPPALLDDTMQRFQLDQDIRQTSAGSTPASQRVALFDARYGALSLTQSPQALAILRSFPGLPTVVADEMVRVATASELELLEQGRVPLRLAEEARVYQQHVRLARAYEGLYLDAVSNPDTEVLILHSVAALPGWSSDLRLEIHQGRFQGRLIDAVGETHASIRKVLVRYADGYQAYDKDGLQLSGRDNLYASVLHALPDAPRAALGFPGTWDGPRLKLAIQNGVLLSRDELRKLLRMQPSVPGRRSPMRLADGRAGYPLSGRGLMPGFVTRDTVLDLMRSIGLGTVSPAQCLATLEAAGLSRETIHQRLVSLIDECDALERSLNTWSDTAATASDPAAQMASRTLIQRAVWQLWVEVAFPELTPSAPSLRLQQVILYDFPRTLPAFFYQRVSRLELVDTNIYALEAPTQEPSAAVIEPRPVYQAFFELFPGVTDLSVSRTDAPSLMVDPVTFQLPRWVGDGFPSLRSLQLINQNLFIGPADVDALRALERLETLDLSGNHISVIPPENLLSLPVRYLGLDRVGLDQWPAWLNGLASSSIAELSLRDNRLTEIPREIYADQTPFPTPTVIALQGNPLSRLALTRIQLDERPGDRFRLLLDLPVGMATQVARLREEGMQLQSVITQWNDGSASIPPLSEESVNARRLIGRIIIDFWRAYSEGQTHSILTLQDVSLGDFPHQLPEFFFMRVRSVQLIRVSTHTEQLDAFIARLLQLQSLELSGSTLSGVDLPVSLRQLTRFALLNLCDQGRLIDQQSIAFFASLPALEVLDLSGNRLDGITDVSALRGRLSWLSLEDAGLTHWPEWLNDLMPLEGLSLENNQLTELPEHILENPRSEEMQTEITLRGNPLSYETMRRAHVSERYHAAYTFVMDLPEEILDLSPERRESESDSDGEVSGSDSSGALHSPVAPMPEELPEIESWLLGTVDENQQHELVWRRIEERGDAGNLMALVGRLTHAAPYRNPQSRAGFANRVWNVLKAADLNQERRSLYNGIAADALLQPETGFQTCHDGAWLVFNQIEIQMYIADALSGVPAEQRGASLYRLTRRLYRLHELDAIAREQAQGRDEAEVRLAYRLRWSEELDLPLPPGGMLYQAHASIRPGELDAALVKVQQGEQSEPFMRYAAQRDFWVEYLREAYADRFETLKSDYLARVIALPDRFPGRAIDELGAEFAALQQAYEAQEVSLIRELTYREGFNQG